MRRILTASLMLLALLAHAETELYRWVGEDGSVHFSDQPGPGAEKIRVENVPTISGPPLNPSSAKPESTAVEFAYDKFAISSPPDKGTVRDNTGAVTVTVEIVPALRVDLGHTVRVSLAGQIRGGTVSQFAFTNIDRGTHSITASVLDKDGKTLMTASSTFTLHRISKLLPKKNTP